MFKNHPQITEFLAKYGMWIAYVLMGLVGKFGWDIISNRVISFRYILGASMCGVFAGYIASVWCINHAPQSGSYIVPVLTLVSRDFFLFLFSLDYNAVLKILLKKDFRK